MKQFLGKYGEPVDETGDGGDSCNRNGQLAVIDRPAIGGDFYLVNGKPVRHPYQKPWDNPKNFTRDQLVPFVCGVIKQRDTHLYPVCEELVKKWFAPNKERDYVGSKKLPYPHWNWKDSHCDSTQNNGSIFNPNSIPFWKGKPKNARPGQLEFSWFNGPDLLTPDVRGLQYLLSNKKRGLIKYIIGKLYLTVAIIALVFRNHLEDTDDWQMLCLCDVYDDGDEMLKFYVKGRLWRHAIARYWNHRNDVYMAEKWFNFLSRYK